MKKLISLVLAVLMIFSVFTVTAITAGGAENAQTVPASGTCGENVQWNFFEADSKLVIYGTGEMDSFTNVDDSGNLVRPWSSHINNIYKIVINRWVLVINIIVKPQILFYVFKSAIINLSMVGWSGNPQGFS